MRSLEHQTFNMDRHLRLDIYTMIYGNITNNYGKESCHA